MDGFTSIEVLVVTTMLAVVLGAFFGLYGVSAAEEQRVGGRVQGLIGQRNGLERMSRELRQATVVCGAWPVCGAFSSSARIEFQRLGTGSTPYWVRYDCSGANPQAVPPALTTRACLRSEASEPDALGGSQRVIVSSLSPEPSGIFSFDGGSYVTISLNVVVKGGSKPITLDDGVHVRNANGVPDSGEQG